MSIDTNDNVNEEIGEICLTDKCLICNRPLSKNGLPVLYADEFRNEFSDGEPGHKLYLGKAVVIAFTGYRGNGKSLSMAHTIAQALAQGLKVWSNLPVKFELIDWDGFKYTSKICETLPLDLNALYQLSAELHDGAVAIDELQYFLDSRRSMTVNNRLINAVLNQIRKRKLDFYYTIKDLSWADKRDVFETDVEFKCHDANWFNQKVPPGITILQHVFDRTGWSGQEIYNGQPVEVCKRKLTHAKRLWNIYNSYAVIDYLEAMNPVSIVDSKTNDLNNTLDNMIASFSSNGTTKISGEDILESLRTNGLNVNDRQIGKMLKNKGLIKHRTREGTVYELSTEGGRGVN